MCAPIFPEYYIRSIPLPGVTYNTSAQLTYCLVPNPTNRRTILLTPHARKFITPDLKAHWERLVRETNNHQSAGNFYQDKSLVSRIRQQPSDFPYFGVVIHHFGPVPVLMTNHTYEIELHGEKVEAKVALYYSRSHESTSENSIFPNKLVLLQSLMGHYDLVMQRYFEDVAKLFHAIADRSNLQEAFDWSKKVEERIGQSIQSKLKESIPSLDDWKKYNAEPMQLLEEEKIIRCDLFRDHHMDIFLAQNFRHTALYYLNEFYKHLGIESRSQDYLEKITTSQNEYDALLGKGASAQLIADINELSQLDKIRKAYRQNDLDQINRSTSNAIWVQGMITFSRFLLYLNQHAVSPAKGRIFISYNHSVPVSEHLKKQIINYYHFHYKESIEVLTVGGQPVDALFGEIIKTQIWQCDRMLVIVAKNTGRLGESSGAGNYRWLAKEAEHGFYLKKTTTYLLETGYDQQLLEETLGSNQVTFLSQNDAEVDRGKKLLDDFKGRTQVNFNSSLDKPDGSWEDLSKEMQDALAHHAKEAIRNRHHHRVMGILRQFSDDNLITLKSVYPLFSSEKRATAQRVETFLYSEFGADANLPFHTKSKIRNSFRNVWIHAKSRSFEFNGKSYTVMEIERSGNKHYYSLSLNKLLIALQPDKTKEEIEDWMEKLLNEACTR